MQKSFFCFWSILVGGFLWAASLLAAEPWDAVEIPTYMQTSFKELYEFSDEELIDFCDVLCKNDQVQEFFSRRVKTFQESPLLWLSVFADRVESESLSLKKIPAKDLFPSEIVTEIMAFMEQGLFRRLENHKDEIEKQQKLNEFELGKEVDLKPCLPPNELDINVVAGSISYFATLKLLSPELVKRYLELTNRIIATQNQIISEQKRSWKECYGINSQLDKLIPHDIAGNDYQIIFELSKYCELPAGTIDSLVAFLKDNYSTEEKFSLAGWNGTTPKVFTPKDCLNHLDHERLFYVLQALGNCGQKAKAAIPYLEYMIGKELEYSETAALALYRIQPANPMAATPNEEPQSSFSIDYGLDHSN